MLIIASLFNIITFAYVIIIERAFMRRLREETNIFISIFIRFIWMKRRRKDKSTSSDGWSLR